MTVIEVGPSRPYPIHAGQYKKQDAAESYADKLRGLGDEVEVKPVTLWEVVVTWRQKK